jgi:hypothetical protein
VAEIQDFFIAVVGRPYKIQKDVDQLLQELVAGWEALCLVWEDVCKANDRFVLLICKGGFTTAEWTD